MEVRRVLMTIQHRRTTLDERYQRSATSNFTLDSIGSSELRHGIRVDERADSGVSQGLRGGDDRFWGV